MDFGIVIVCDCIKQCHKYERDEAFNPISCGLCVRHTQRKMCIHRKKAKQLFPFPAWLGDWTGVKWLEAFLVYMVPSGPYSHNEAQRHMHSLPLLGIDITNKEGQPLCV